MKILIVTLALFLLSCGGSAPTPPAPTTVTTSAGIRVTSITSLSLGHLAEIDNQYDELLRIAAASPNNYEVYPAPDQVQIFIVARDLRCRQIAFVTVENVAKGTNYDGTEYDLDGEVNGRIEMCNAGRYNTSNGSIEVTADGIVSTDIVRYELEHWLLWRVDRPRFWQTVIHTAANPHPILGNGGIQKALASPSGTQVQ